MTNRLKLSSTIFLAVLILGPCFIGLHFAVGQTDDVASKLQAANTAVDQAFSAVSEAEKAGANVTSLLAQLNDAAGILAHAENTYRSGNPSTAASQADSVIPIAQQVTTQAQTAQQTATVNSKNAFWFTIAFTVIGAFVFVLALFLVWRLVKRRYA
jgi:hypothetical protein